MIDVLAACVDMFQNTLMIMMALRILCVRIRPFRVCFAAFFGAAAAFTARYAPLSRSLLLLVWGMLAAAMMRIAAGRAKGISVMIQRTLTLLACAGFLGGVVLALEGVLGSLYAAHGVSTAAAGSVFVTCVRAGRAAQTVRSVHVRCIIAESVLEFDAMVDSGNTLRDYITHRPVIVAGEDAMIRKKLEGVPTRMIFADTAGGRLMMRMVIPKETIILTHRTQMHVHAALAFSPGMKAGMPALVPLALIQKEG